MKRSLISAVFFVLFSVTSFAAPPRAPSLTAKIDGVNVNLSWTEVEDATGYALYYTPSPFLGTDFIKRFDKGNNKSDKLTFLLGSSYFVALKAYNVNKEESGYSNIELVTIDQFNMLYLGLSRHQHNSIELDVGTFQLAADVDQTLKLASVRLITPDNTVLPNINIKKSNQIEMFVKGDLARMEPYLLEGTYRLEGNYYLESSPSQHFLGKAAFNVKRGSYPPYPEVTSPIPDAIDVSLNPSITFYSEKPITVSITKQNNQEEVFFSSDVKYILESDGAKTIKIDSVTLEPKTKYLLEINQTDMSIAKGSTSAVAFTTK